MKKEKKITTTTPAAPPLPAHTQYTNAGMRRDKVRPVVHTPLPDEDSVIEEMQWVMENQK